MDKIRQQEELGAHRIVKEFYQAFPTDVVIYKQGNRNQLLKHLKPVPTIFDPKIEDESAATSHMKVPVSTATSHMKVPVSTATSHMKVPMSTEEISKNEYFKKMKMKLSRSCADLSSQ